MIRSLIPATDIRAAFYEGKSKGGEPLLSFVPVQFWGAVDFGGTAENAVRGFVLWHGGLEMADDIDVFCGFLPEAAILSANNSHHKACLAQALVVQKARDMREVN